MEPKLTSIQRLFQLLSLDRTEIRTIYLYAVVSGIIALSLPLGIQSIISFIMAGQVSKSWILLVFVVVVGILISGLLTVFQIALTERLQQKIFFRSANEFAYRIPRFKLETMTKHFAPELINRFFDTINIQKGLAKLLIDVPSAILQIFFGLLLLAFYHPFFVVFGVILIIGVVAVFRYTFPRGLETSLQESMYKYKVAFWLEELGRLLGTFKLSGNAPIVLEKTDRFVTGYIQARKAHFRILIIQFANLIGFKALITGFLLLLGGFLVIDNQISIGQFVASEIIIVLIINSSEKLLHSVETLFDLLTAITKVGDVMDVPLEIENYKGNYVQVPDGPFGIRIKNLDFQIGMAGEDYHLKNVNLEVKPGQVVMITGKSGSGKSHLLHLIAAHYTEYYGSIEIAGLPLRNWDRDELRGYIGDYFSEENIFWGTITENITMGRNIETSFLLDIAESLKLDDFINQLPDGYETEINPEGTLIPDNIRKKILLARSLAGKPRLLLSEDITTGTDRRTMESYLNFILSKKTETTFVAVAHSDFLASRSDLIVVMAQGMITWKGTYDEFKVHPEFQNLL
jgi:ABC-type bacteriocin/lantibiotic exporter with double-glycine peptidase domain